MATVQYAITCLCGAAAQTVTSGPLPKESTTLGIYLCHCAPCRHNTGVLSSSYRRLGSPPSTEGLKVYHSSSGFQKYFCETCGCQVFYRRESVDENGETQVNWVVSTGVISGRVNDDTKERSSEDAPFEPGYVRHIRTASTKDGGLSPWIPEVGGRKMEFCQHTEPDKLDDVAEPDTVAESGDGAQEKLLPAFCRCGTVRFHITRPDDASRTPRSNFSDLIVPFHTASPRITNPDDTKWWLRPEDAATPTKYLAGTCACRPCRLASGFEIQTWAFVPRVNIFFHVPSTTSSEGTSDEAHDVRHIPLDFATLPPGILRTYESSPGVLRESCVKCGATVFWHDKWRPDLIDVSVGLLDAPEGARAESWLEWWTGRVSFAEEVGTGRFGIVEARARELIEALEKGMKS